MNHPRADHRQIRASYEDVTREALSEHDSFGREEPARDSTLPDRSHETAARHAVRIEEDEVVTAGRERCQVEHTSLPETFVRLPHVAEVDALAPPLDDGRDLLAGPVVGYDHLEWLFALLGKRPEDELEGVRPLVGREHNREGRISGAHDARNGLTMSPLETFPLRALGQARAAPLPP